MEVAGGILALGGLALAVRSALLLVGRGRPKRGPKPPFVIAGPYTRVRNPLFAGLLLGLAGLAIALRCPVLGAVTLAGAIALHLWVVLREEPRLRVRFGAVYETYLNAVPRWIPRAKTRAGSAHQP